MTQALPNVYPHSYRVEYQDAETGEWILYPPAIHVELTIMSTIHRLWFFKWRQAVVTNYREAILEARRKAFRLMGARPRTRIVEVLQLTMSGFPDSFSKRVVWENGRWLEDID